jgi:hypothetical protein
LSSSIELLRHLVRAAITDDAARLRPALEQYGAHADREWAWCELVFSQNRLAAPIGAALVRAAAGDVVPAAVYARLAAAYEVAAKGNAARMNAYAELTRALRERGVELLLLKSSALVALEIMHLGSSMTDVDALVSAHLHAVATDVLAARGYAPAGSQRDTGDWLDPSGALRLDLHHSFGLFAHLDLGALTVAREARYPGLGQVRVLEPNAFLVHLIVHLNEHRPELGYQLCWLIDVGRALGAWRDELRWEAMSRLVQWPHQRLWMLRTMRFFECELDVALPADLAAHAAAFSPVTLAEVLRSRRTQPWRFQRLRGWKSLLNCLLGKDELRHRVIPQPADPFVRVIDVFRERRDRRRLRLAAQP